MNSVQKNLPHNNCQATHLYSKVVSSLKSWKKEKKIPFAHPIEITSLHRISITPRKTELAGYLSWSLWPGEVEIEKYM